MSLMDVHHLNFSKQIVIAWALFELRRSKDSRRTFRRIEARSVE